MTRFYTHLSNGSGYLKDETGTDLADMEAARGQAITTGADIIADELKGGSHLVNVTLFVEDAAHAPLATIRMSATIGE